MERIELKIICTDDHTKSRCTANKWKFQDTMMGEQFITFSITSEVPIDFAVGDFCIFRGETYTLNYIPSVTQKARTKERQDAYTYENVKLESFQEELTRCTMLDITPTTGDYIAALGTNYTGSSIFQLFCGEISANGETLTAVCALAAKMQANLDRMFPTNGWKIFVDTTTTYKNSAGEDILVTHTEDKVLSFNNTTVAKALEEVHNTFDLDYCVRGRTIRIGYSLKDLTSDIDSETFAFGYGKGYPTHEDMNKGLFQIKRIANSQQKIVTRLRALGSTKNMPYRYYNKKYGLSQALFPTNLQLPDTFATPEVKAANNALRDSSLRAVKGDTNDAYIDKNDDAEHCAEGIREDSACWDGSDSNLPEIYPTIEEVTYGELRNAKIQDQDGNTGSNSFPNYDSSERIDKLLAIGYKDGNTLVDDANKGDGILDEDGAPTIGVAYNASIDTTSLNYNTSDGGAFANKGDYYAGPERTLFTVQGVSAGMYAMSPTGPSFNSVVYSSWITYFRNIVSVDVGYVLTIKQRNLQTGKTTDIATYSSEYKNISNDTDDRIVEMELPELPDVKNGSDAKVLEIKVTALSDIIVTFTPVIRNIVIQDNLTNQFQFGYRVGKSSADQDAPYDPEYNWVSLDDSSSIQQFHVFIQDMGFDLQAVWTSETPVMSMKSGRCVGREFEIGERIEKVIHNGKKGYMLTLNRATDSTLNTYYPSETDPIAAGDHFVLLNVVMPDAFIKAAEIRLLRAATDHLADNCETQFTYQPDIDDIYLQRNLDICRAKGREQDSIWWRLYAGLKFTFIARLESGDEDKEDSLVSASVTIEQVSISMGEGLTPKVELKLNDDIQQSTIQKLTTSVDRIYNGSIFNSSGSSSPGIMSATLLSLLQSEGEKRFLSKRQRDRARGKIIFEEGIEIGGDKNGYIDGKANAELLTLIVRDLLKSPNFRDGFDGEGWRIWMEDALSHLTIDRLTVRRTLTAFEYLIMKVRSVGGQIAVSAANGKIKSVTRQGDVYFITFEDGCDFVRHDLMRCATWKGGKEQHAFWVEIVGVTAGVAWVLASEFDGVEPMVGDECVLMGNTENPLRQNMILISATEDGKPRIDVMDGINKKSFEGCLRARLGNLDGINDSWFPANNQPHGDGLYADNAYLRGTFLLSTGEDIKTKFEIVEGMISSAVESVRQDFAEGEGFLSNPLFADGFNHWSAESDTGFLTVGNSWIWANGGILSKQGDGAVLSVDRDRTVVNIKNTSIVQKAADYYALPKIETNADGKKEAASVYLSFLYKVRKAGTLSVHFEGLDKTGFENFSPLAVEEALAETEDYRQYTCSGLWNGTGDFTLGFTGEISVCMIVLSTDRIEALTYTYKTLFEQSEKLVKIAAENFDEDGNILGGSQIVTKYDMNLITTGIYDDNGNLIEGAGLVTTPKGSGLFAFDNQGGLAQVGAYTENGEGIILLKGNKIRLEGAITANGNVTIDKDGRITAVDGTFSGSITANSGKIGLFTIDSQGLYYGEQNKWYDGNYKQDLAYITPGAVRIQNEVGVFGEGDVANIKVAFGDYADPSLEVDDDGSPLFNFRGCSAGYIYRQSVSLPPYEYFPAVKIISDNAIGRDVALYTKGAIICQGGLWGAACIMDVGTGSDEYNVIAPDKGSTILLRNPGGARLYMPKLAEMKRMMQTDGAFAVPLRLVSLNGNRITTIFFNDGESKTNFLRTTGDSRAFIQLSSCNTVDILLIYNGTDDFYAIVQ